MSSRTNFNTPAAISRLLKLAGHIAKHPNHTVTELAAISSFSASTVRDYLSHMIDLRIASSEPLPGVMPRTLGWVVADNYAAVLEQERERILESHAPKERADAGLPRVETVSVWPLHMVRDSLVAALFGEARVAA